MVTLENEISLKSVITIIEAVNTIELKVMKTNSRYLLDEVENDIIDLIENKLPANDNGFISDKETLFYVRLSRAKCEEILDIIDLKRTI